MEPWLSNLDVWAWRYADPPGRYRGAHLTALPAACDALLRALDLLEAEGPGCRRTVPLRQLRPEYEAQVTGGMAHRAFRTLRLVVEERTDDLRQYSVGEHHDDLVITCTPGGSTDLREALSSVREGFGDGSIRPLADRQAGLQVGERDRRSLDLWYWPCFGHLVATLVPESLAGSG